MIQNSARIGVIDAKVTNQAHDMRLSSAQAMVAFSAGRLDEAELICRCILEGKASDFDVHHLLGAIQARRGRFDQAIASYDSAIIIEPGCADIYYNRGNALAATGQADGAQESYRKAVAIRFGDAQAYYNRANALVSLKRFHEAVGSYDAAIAINPHYVKAYCNRGNALRSLQCVNDSIISYQRAITTKVNYIEAWSNLGNSLIEIGCIEDAVRHYELALTIKPNGAEIYSNLAAALLKLERSGQALESCDKAIAIKLDHAEAFSNRGKALAKLNGAGRVLQNYDNAIALKPDYADAYFSRGRSLVEAKLLVDALDNYERAIAVDPSHKYASSTIAACAAKLCDWKRRVAISNTLHQHIAANRSVVAPFVMLGYSHDPMIQLQCSRNWVHDQVRMRHKPLWDGQIWCSEKIRVAYVSADFRRHPMSYLIAELLECHDRSKFEIIGVSLGPDDKSDIGTRVMRAFDQFYNVNCRNDAEVARLLFVLRTSIAVDLMGHTRGGRINIFAQRPAPIQVSYLGFPGTTGADFIDYIIVDPIVVPMEQQPLYTERLVYLPNCYLVNDSKRVMGENILTRSELGLPNSGVVFCCFNGSFKINSVMFSVWMRLLRLIEGSVLWLIEDNVGAIQNLRREAQERGVDPARLIFAPIWPNQEHLARYRLADLFLDTLPCNAHTTASDALWAGLPVITCLGNTFAGRVAASLLNAIGLDELVAKDIAQYETLALALARDPGRLANLKATLVDRRSKYPLFDTNRFRRNMEAAYTNMWHIWQHGQKPCGFTVHEEA